MPAVNEDGSLKDTETHFACDARGTQGGALCPEFSLFQGNRYGFRTTPRTCDAPNENGFFTSCDGEGKLAIDVNDQTEFTYGPGGDIDTNHTITFKVDFHADGDTLIGYDVTISQGDQSYTMSADGAYLAELSKYLKQGMVIQIS